MRLFFGLIIMLFSFSAWAQSINGSIVSDEGEPVYDITVSLYGTTYRARTNQNGEFTLQNVPQGRYILVATAISYSAIKQDVVVTNNNVFLNLKLIKATRELKEVLVTASRNVAKDQASNYAAKLPLRNIENAQVISLVPNQIITEQASLDFNSMLKNG